MTRKHLSGIAFVAVGLSVAAPGAAHDGVGIAWHGAPFARGGDAGVAHFPPYGGWHRGGPWGYGHADPYRDPPAAPYYPPAAPYYSPVIPYYPPSSYVIPTPRLYPDAPPATYYVPSPGGYYGGYAPPPVGYPAPLPGYGVGITIGP